MSNMSYCRFENTFKDLQDCHENMSNELSPSEAKYRTKLINLCKEITMDFGEEDLSDEGDDIE